MGKCAHLPEALSFEALCPGFAAPSDSLYAGKPVFMDQGHAQAFMVCAGCGSNQFHVTPVDFVCCSCKTSHSD